MVGFGRIPPGHLFWVPLSIFMLFSALILGGWAAAAGSSLFTLFTGRVPEPGADVAVARWLATGLLVLLFVIAALSRVVTRALELLNWVVMGFVLLSLLLLTIFLVPADIWWEGITGILTPAAPPAGISATEVGALVGFAAMASGLSWFALAHQRDKGYGMGSRVGYIAGLRSEGKEVRASGCTFPDDEKNTAMWKRWNGYLRIEIWGVFFIGAFIGMLLPSLLMTHAVRVSGETPTTANLPVFKATALGDEYAPALFIFILLIGLLVLFTTQVGIFDALVRTFTDGLHSISPGFRRLMEGDPHRFYFIFMAVLIVLISITIRFAAPVRLVMLSANMANMAALVFPFAVIYLNRRLPRAARPSWWHNAALVMVAVFFGFFFFNFLSEFITGQPLVVF